jgi:hypothetical protein
MTSRGLIVSKSALYDFHSPELRSDNTQLCISHMDSRPVGDTRSLTCPDGKEVESFQQLWHDKKVCTSLVL